MSDGLSKTMLAVLAVIRDHGGIIERKPGGFWTYPECPCPGIWEWWAGSTTIGALVRRNELRWTEWQSGKRGKFPIRAELSKSDA